MLESLHFFSDSRMPFYEIIEALPNGLIVVDSSGIIKFCNVEIEQLFGYSKEELYGQLVEILIPSHFRAHHPQYLKAFFVTPQKRSMGAGRDLYGLHKSGKEFPIEIGLNPLQTDQGTYVLASVVDISKRKTAEEKFRLVVESSPNSLLIVDKEQHIVHVNSQTEKTFGYDRSELFGKPVDLLIPLRFRERHPEYVRSFFADPQSRPMGAGRDLYGRCKDGSEIPVEIGLTPLLVEGQQLILATIVNITERKKIEQAIQQKNLEMEQFVYVVSHDLKSPIVTSTSFIAFIREDLPQPCSASVLDSLSRLEHANSRMVQLIDDLLNLSRIGRLELKRESFSVVDLIQEIWQDLELDQHQAKAILDVQPDIPMLYADRFRFYQLFENLLSNALKYGISHLEPRISVGFRRDERELCLFVKDNGAGIDPKYHKRIFGLFERLQTEFEGTGIGLTIVARVAELHGGRVWVESSLGQGTTFWVSIPHGTKTPGLG